MHLAGISFALLSAVLFGGGDFGGGFATRRRHPIQVLAWSALSGLIILGSLAWVVGEPLPSLHSALWAAGAGLAGALGLVALYRALSMGHAAIVSPLAGVIGAMLPVVVGAIIAGLPRPMQMLGFVSAMLGIALVTRTASSLPPATSKQVLLAVLSGVGFGAFFILAAQVEDGAVLWPLMIAKGAATCLAWGTALLGQRRVPVFPGSGIAWLSGVLDAVANAFYLLAQQYTRLDVAVVLSSLYPAFTVLLAFWLLNERISRAQWVGVGLCSAAIALVAL
jgi:drug/metabolite transporter (DMT)-like permease